MKRIINTAIVYFIFAMAGGVFYREFTKWNGYTEPTTLGVLQVAIERASPHHGVGDRLEGIIEQGHIRSHAMGRKDRRQD